MSAFTSNKEWFINHEAEYKQEQAGVFQTSIIGIGSLSIIYRFDFLATLKQNVLVKKFHAVLGHGVIFEPIAFGTIKAKEKPKKDIGYLEERINQARLTPVHQF
ncbi:hypothetical protein [Pedobacter sp. UC225_65]|uniref:hypothetical protein n=1 Tax=Pedobacter sp. UC225_65 TaxID=3350173 RepID=UPI00366B4EAC